MLNLPVIIVAALIFLAACEKDISVNLQQQEQQLVVEGTFENGRYPQVVLTRSLDYFSSIDPARLQGSFVHDAVVTVADSTRSMTLKETVVNIPGLGKVFAYLPDTARGAGAFRGRSGTRYTLRINAANKSYETMTLIPLVALQLDSVWWTRTKVKDDTTKARLWVRVTDPPELGNYGRYFTKRNSEPFYPGLNSVVDDQVVNGTTFEIPMDAGVNRNKSIDLDTYALFDRGDTVTVKFCNIDQATYNFWRTLDFAFNSNGNPFSNPVKIMGNVPGALGYWGGYSVTYKTIIIRK